MTEPQTQHHQQPPDPHELKQACAAWLAVMIERIDSGRLPIPDLGHPDLDVSAAAFVDRLAIAPYIPDARWVYNDFWNPAPPSRLIDRMLERLHRETRGMCWEPDFWSAVWEGLPTRLPRKIAESLIRREINIDELGHLLLDDDLLWRLADRVDEALLTLAKRRYHQPRYDADAFEEVLYAFPTHDWMLRSLRGLVPSHEEKAERLQIYLDRYFGGQQQ